jgi:hypothetical protein
MEKHAKYSILRIDWQWWKEEGAKDAKAAKKTTG